MTVIAVVNAKARRVAALGADGARARLAAAFAAQGIALDLRLVDPRAMGGALDDAVRALDAAAGRCRVLVAGGGDGTVSAAVARLIGSDIALGVLPLGTLNHFARDIGVPDDLDLAAATVAIGSARSIDAAEVNGRVFVNNALIGIYPYMVAKRDAQLRALGLGKWAAMALAAGAAVRRFPLHRLRVSTPHLDRPQRTPCVFIGNNLYRLDPFAFGRRDALDRGELCVFLARGRTRLEFFRLLAKAALGRLSPGADLEQLSVTRGTIFSNARRLRVAVDGELVRMKPPLQFHIRPRALRVIVPAREALSG